jgi:ATP-binding cassette subfamily F protein 3
VQVAHYWQEAEDLDESVTVLDELLNRTSLGLQASRYLLGLMLFSGEDVFKSVGALSGGERSRLALARLSASGANLLLLDEPTNHLDIPSREALEAALDSYEGTLIFASHDRRLISTLADRLWVVEDGRIVTFEGSWDEYQESRQAAASAPSSPVQETSAVPGVPAPRGVGEYRRRLLVERLESEIAGREADLADLSAELEQASADADVARLAGVGWRFSEVQAELAALLDRWAEAADGSEERP